ncbi:MAG: DUF2344 domain-containing protein [Chloroflexi bacterium]|nr:DUF2344 domain-containing protein [Chloroflexota bacterium]
MQRVRLRFARGEAVKYVGHLDFLRFWERAVRRAGLPLAYSQGHHAHPRIALAAPLPVGYTSEAELIDLFLERPISHREVLTRLAAQVPPGIDLMEAVLLDPQAPSLQSLMQACRYRVRLDTEGQTAADVEATITRLLQQETLPWEWQRDTEVKRIDLRALVEDLTLEEWRGHECILSMRLVHDSNASGRPELVTQALGFSTYPRSIHRTELSLKRPVPTPAALVRQGRPRSRSARPSR